MVDGEFTWKDIEQLWVACEHWTTVEIMTLHTTRMRLEHRVGTMTLYEAHNNEANGMNDKT